MQPVVYGVLRRVEPRIRPRGGRSTRRLFVFVLAAVLLMGLAVPGHAGKTGITSFDIALTCPASGAPYLTTFASSDGNRKHVLVVGIFDTVTQQGYVVTSDPTDGSVRSGSHAVNYTGPVQDLTFTDTNFLGIYGGVALLLLQRQGALREIERWDLRTLTCFPA